MKRLIALLALLLACSTPAMAALGQDADGNGIWDDVQRYIDRTFASDREGTQAARQFSSALQRFATMNLNVESEQGRLTKANDLLKGMTCFFYVRRHAAKQDITALRNRILSTDERRKAFELSAAAQNADGSNIGAPVEWWRNCSFQATVIPNWPDGESSVQ